jgi:hypothetical protein
MIWRQARRGLSGANRAALPRSDVVANSCRAAGGRRTVADSNRSIASLAPNQAFAEEDSLPVVVAIGFWTAAVAVAICLLLIVGQQFYMRRTWLRASAAGRGCLK